ncbi:endoglucanase-4 [Magnaporthiopsis poae ATCC 64411]|uniref:lytic cellulose monooxygenase (C4-dehydrogenating) n=1 Tax=Magnaporthiopsis poae (strain ATCC 64411 / 73-15) TaxID=644358 RepID=A0A0C4DWA9_MAGP6|nr:endoglucanase-4 [Magnaporthiopsis poae ATCC 64411]
MSSFTPKTLLAALAGAASVAAHGHVRSWTVNGKTYPGFVPFNAVPGTVGWSTTATDNGFVAPSAFNTRDIACHRGSANAKSSIQVKAGDTIVAQWDQWAHPGPIIDYLAPCGSAGCDKVDVTTLKFFKIDEAGLENGKWPTDKLMAQGNKWEITIPVSLAAGPYVLRHELFGLHSAGNPDGAQLYPQCANIEVTGSGTESPEGVLATKLYSANDPGILFNMYNGAKSYIIPGPPLAIRGGQQPGQ